MQPQNAPDLWRTQLCRHGPHHAMPRCWFAHKLSELSAPVERRILYTNRWRDMGVDRFYGQRMSDDQVVRIRDYYRREPVCDRPLWAHALRLLEQGNEAECAYAYPWDFGLARDYDDLLDRRAVRECPFDFYPGLWARLQRRRQAMFHYPYPQHPLLVMDSLPGRPLPGAAIALPPPAQVGVVIAGPGDRVAMGFQDQARDGPHIEEVEDSIESHDDGASQTLGEQEADYHCGGEAGGSIGLGSGRPAIPPGLAPDPSDMPRSRFFNP